MEAQDVVYGIARNYIQDRRQTLPSTLYLKLLGKLRARKYRELATCVTDFAQDVTGAEAMRTLLQVEAFFSKNAIFTKPMEARLAALLTFEEGEELCKATNDRLDDFYEDPDYYPDLQGKIKKMVRFIERVLGNHDVFIDKLPMLINVTAGATATAPRRKSIPFLKVNKRMHCTFGAYPYLNCLAGYFGYGPIQGRIVSRNRVEFVPKSFKTERTIACEAEGNMFLQLAFDKYVKQCLLRIGINLSDQTRNQELARVGSIDGDLATVDLKMASDTLAYNTVALLFPEDWWRYLCDIRSHSYEMYPDKIEKYAKFSSMGNGATFGLETLIFAACCHAVGSVYYSVYGDDIIIETELVPELFSLLAFLGFVPNTVKTHTKGPFRESCGKSWYLGVDVTPRYIRELDDRKITWCTMVNNLVAVTPIMGDTWDYLRRLIADKKLPLVPLNESTISGIWITPNEAYQRKLIKTFKGGRPPSLRKSREKGSTTSPGRSPWVPAFKGFIPKVQILENFDSRSLFLWYLRTVGRKTVKESFISSRYSMSSHKYERRWIHWIPVTGTPDYLYWWSDFLSPKCSVN